MQSEQEARELKWQNWIAFFPNNAGYPSNLMVEEALFDTCLRCSSQEEKVSALKIGGPEVPNELPRGPIMGGRAKGVIVEYKIS